MGAIHFPQGCPCPVRGGAHVGAIHFSQGCPCPVSGAAQVDALLLFLGGKAANDDQDSKAGILDSPLARK